MKILKIIENGRFDLHLHTTASDGSFSPNEVVQMAAQKGLTAIAITDHDTFDGFEEASQTGNKLGITVIKGMELNTKFKGLSIDILGYHLGDSQELLAVLQKMRLHRQNRSKMIINKFCEIGMPIDEKDVLNIGQGKVIARPHIAQAVVNKGYANNIQEVFDLYLGNGKMCAVDKMALSTSEGINLIHRAGGIAVLAHPLLIKDDSIVDELMQLPLDGIEVWHRKHNQEEINRYKETAKKYQKIMTGGSDFHQAEHIIGEFGFDGF